ncbi:MAG: Rrf2 family transcriptional regulator [Ignavibacteriales bacterium]|nr:Rrf2 family transcriptional regulator [Ignavibacteriales bacterium]
MFQLSKKVEYGLIVLRHMAMKPRGQVFTAKELANEYEIPYELLAKVLQKLAKSGIVVSMQGVKGGYALGQKPEAIIVSDIIRVIEKERPMLAGCYVDGPLSCSIFDICTIRKPLEKIQKNINSLFDKMTIQEIV